MRAFARPLISGTTRRRGLSQPNHYSYGSTAAISTSVGLIVGLGAASVQRSAIVSSLLIIALADNLSDSLSIHVYQESENLEARDAFHATLTNFAARLLVAMSFVAIVVSFPSTRTAAILAVAWGAALLTGLSLVLSRLRHLRPWRQISEHLAVAAIVTAASRILGAWIAANFP